MIHNSTRRGFTLLYAVLVASLVLSIGVGIASIVLKEIILASAGRESQFAFYAADSGIECALYSDFQAASAFATSTDDPLANTPATILCNGNSITLPVLSAQNKDARNATTTFLLWLAPAPSCATVTVVKNDFTGSGASVTKVESRAQNDCQNLANPLRVERAIRVRY